MTCGTTSSQVSSEPDRLASFVALIATLRKSAFLLCKFVALVIFAASYEKSQNPQKDRHGIRNHGPSPGGSCHQLLSFRCDAAR